MLKQQLTDDLKQAMLSGDKPKVELIKMLKSAILYKEVADGTRDEGLTDEQIVDVLSKEAKKRQESADLYTQAGETDRANQEFSEKAVIDTYLPKKISEDELEKIIDSKIAELKPEGMKDMGRVIGAVKSEVGNTADGAIIAQLVKQKLG